MFQNPFGAVRRHIVSACSSFWTAFCVFMLVFSSYFVTSLVAAEYGATPAWVTGASCLLLWILLFRFMHRTSGAWWGREQREVIGDVDVFLILTALVLSAITMHHWSRLVFMPFIPLAVFMLRHDLRRLKAGSR